MTGHCRIRFQTAGPIGDIPAGEFEGARKIDVFHEIATILDVVAMKGLCAVPRSRQGDVRVFLSGIWMFYVGSFESHCQGEWKARRFGWGDQIYCVGVDFVSTQCSAELRVYLRSPLSVLSNSSYRRVHRGNAGKRRGGPHDFRLMSGVASSTRTVSTGSSAIRRSSILVATRPISRSGWRTVVRAGVTKAA
jgi:hypothetical protein